MEESTGEVKKILEVMEMLPSSQMPFDVYYSMDSEKRGYGLIFSHEHYDEIDGTPLGDPRPETKEDVKKMEATLNCLGFQVIKYDNLTHDQIKETLNEIAKRNELECHDCLIVVVLTHGHEDDKICASNAIYDLKDLVEPFLVTNCPQLKEKPKLFFIQACKGNERMDTVDIDDIIDTNRFKDAYENKTNVPKQSDVLISYSTLDGYVSYKDPTWGSPYIHILSTELQKYGRELDLYQILTRVHYTLSKNLYLLRNGNPQLTVQPSFFSYLNKLVRFVERKGDLDDPNNIT